MLWCSRFYSNGRYYYNFIINNKGTCSLAYIYIHIYVCIYTYIHMYMYIKCYFVNNSCLCSKQLCITFVGFVYIIFTLYCTKLMLCYILTYISITLSICIKLPGVWIPFLTIQLWSVCVCACIFIHRHIWCLKIIKQFNS